MTDTYPKKVKEVRLTVPIVESTQQLIEPKANNQKDLGMDRKSSSLLTNKEIESQTDVAPVTKQVVLIESKSNRTEEK